MDYHTWLKRQLKRLDEIPEFDLCVADDLAEVVTEAQKRASLEGLPSAVSACGIRRAGGVGIGLTRQILTECLAACQPQESPTLTAREVASRVGCSVRTLWRWEAQGKIPEGRRIGRSVRWDKIEIEIWLEN